MSKRFYYDEFSDDIFDEQIDDYPSNFEICEILNKQQQQIEELEQKLSDLKETKAQELAEYLDTSIPEFIVNEKVKLLERVKEEFDCCYSGDTYSPYQIADKIDEIIAELTHQHEDKGE